MSKLKNGIINLLKCWQIHVCDFSSGTVVKNLSANAGDTKDIDLIPGFGRSLGIGNDNPSQYSCLKYSMDRGAWRAMSMVVTKSETQLRDRISVQFSCSVVSDSWQPHESQHARPPCPSPSPGVHSNSCPSSRWCHPAISSSVVPFSSSPQSLPASESFPMNQLFAWGDQSTGVSALASFLPKNTQGWFPSEWAGWIFLQSKGLSRDRTYTHPVDF